ncbi:unnamed protein product [Cyprideis torosa]|uniref:Uncharacterized protein n=1 Tax=Cyprideis torosa TaxID=163714 RepID=A0A7R8WKQ0_9CRUS|nr:unnamed protein product [Cyprideis torosa]CAG0896369.1 unnamed protein product [Cyprideis torosa]
MLVEGIVIQGNRCVMNMASPLVYPVSS